ncbi:CD44 antigen isoform X7 [Falco peregrinus]|uniref:CD44 antigen isoform X7 n=1 Tax=Falco peregrinus TaxID=8954 RepID=UPI00247AFC91|nr:CD44 antigen isoform X7 [Falco peregrinus]
MNHVLTAPGPHRENLEKATTQAQWDLISNHWWWLNPAEKTQEPTQATKADVISSGNGSDDEDSSEDMIYPTVFPDWDRSVTKNEYAPSTTPGPHRENLEKATTQAQWDLISNHWWWLNPAEKTQEPTQATKADVISSGNGSDDEDSSEDMIYPTVFPDWDRSVTKNEYAPSTTVDSQYKTPLEISTQDHWNSAYTDEEEQYPSSAGRALVTSENGNRQGPTQHPLLMNSVHSGWISQEQNPANTTWSTEQHEFTVAGENDIEKESSHTAMVSSHGAKQNNSVQEPLVYPGWDQGEDYTTQPAIMDRIIPSRENNHEKESSTAAVAFPDGAYHEDPTRPPLSSDMEPGQGTEGSTHPTDAPGSEVLYSTTASTRKPGDDSSLTATITASTDVLKPQDITQEAWAPHIMVTAIASPDGGHHEDPTQPPLSSDMEPGQGTEGSTHPTDAPGNEVLYSTTASTRKPGDDSSLTATITESVDDVNREKATKEPQSPGTPPGSESEQANTTDSSHLSWVPGVFPDIEDHLNQLQTPLPTRSTSSIYGDQGPHKGHYESTTFPGDTTTTKIVSQRRSAQVPEWLIIVAALVALALILAVCIAVNSRRRCGQKKKLVINNGKGAVEDRKTSGLNGDASKSQEMVHLVHKEQSNDRTGACDEFLTINETQNHQEFDMKSGV